MPGTASQMLNLASHGYRVIAHDHCGHGPSIQPWHGDDTDTYANDLAALAETHRDQLNPVLRDFFST
jgi:alpha-beta hydrolase superfamily lysophospholipase